MKRITTFITCFMLALGVNNAFASIKVFSTASQPSNGKDYVGTIVDVIYTNEDGQQSIKILTLNDGKNESNLTGLHLKIDGNDLPFGMVLANSLGKKIAVYGGTQLDTDAEIISMQLVTDEFWYGDNTKLHK